MPELTGKADVTLEFEAFCGKCGAGLCGNVTTEERRQYPRITVDPCEKCLEDAKDEGRAEADK